MYNAKEFIKHLPVGTKVKFLCFDIPDAWTFGVIGVNCHGQKYVYCADDDDYFFPDGRDLVVVCSYPTAADIPDNADDVNNSDDESVLITSDKKVDILRYFMALSSDELSKEVVALHNARELFFDSYLADSPVFEVIDSLYAVMLDALVGRCFPRYAD